MTIEETRKKILEDDDFVLAETRKIRYLYELKKEIRYALNRGDLVDTESVAEHIYGMHVIANYFLPLENTEENADALKVFKMITWHDMDEIETGDTVSHWKTDTHIKEAKAAIPTVLSKMPQSLKSEVEKIITEYENQVTFEAKFVKAIDKAEPLFEVWGTTSYKEVLHRNNNTIDDHFSTKFEYVKQFQYIKRFFDVITKQLESEGYFLSVNDKI